MAAVRGNGPPRGLAGLSVSRDSSSAADDTFPGTSLSGKWVLSSPSPGPTVSGGAVAFSSLAAGRYMYQIPVGGMPTAFSIYARITALSTPHAMTGIFAVNSAGAGVGCSTYDSGFGTFTWLLNSFQYTASGNGTGYLAPDMWLRLRLAANQWYAASALHDPSKTFANQPFGAESAGFNPGTTYDRIGFGSFFGAATATLKEFRYVV